MRLRAEEKQGGRAGRLIGRKPLGCILHCMRSMRARMPPPMESKNNGQLRYLKSKRVDEKLFKKPVH